MSAQWRLRPSWGSLPREKEVLTRNMETRFLAFAFIIGTPTLDISRYVLTKKNRKINSTSLKYGSQNSCFCYFNSIFYMKIDFQQRSKFVCEIMLIYNELVLQLSFRYKGLVLASSIILIEFRPGSKEQKGDITDVVRHMIIHALQTGTPFV